MRNLIANIMGRRAPVAPEPEQRIEPSVGPVVENATGDSWEVLRGIFTMDNPVAGQQVNERTAMRVSTVYACVRLIAGAIAGLPVHIYRRTGNGERERVYDHPYAELLNRRPLPAFTAPSFWEFQATQMLLRGDGLAYLMRNRAGDVVGMIPLKRNQVVIRQVFDSNPRNGYRLRYLVSTDEGSFGADQDDILHLTGLGFDGCESLSVIEWGARTATGVAIGADGYAAKFFEGGAQPQHVIKAAGKMSESQQQAFREAWVAKYAGKGPSQIPLILTEGLDISELTMTARDAQLLESRQWQVVDIARAFGVPPHMVGAVEKSTSWGSGIEQMGIGFVQYTLGPHLRRWQAEINHKLFGGSDLYAEHNVSGLLQGDHEARSNFYQRALGGTQNPGWMTPNEVRRLENRPPVEGGDRLYTPEAANEPQG